MVGNVSIARWHMGVLYYSVYYKFAFLQQQQWSTMLSKEMQINATTVTGEEERVLGLKSKALIWISIMQQSVE